MVLVETYFTSHVVSALLNIEQLAPGAAHKGHASSVLSSLFQQHLPLTVLTFSILIAHNSQAILDLSSSSFH